MMEKTYEISHESWAWDAFLAADYEKDGVVAEVLIRVLNDDGTLMGEFPFRWHRMLKGVGEEMVDSPRLEVFDDAWLAFLGCPELLGWLGAHSGKMPTPEDLTLYLDSKGYTDTTAHDNKCWTVDQT